MQYSPYFPLIALFILMSVSTGFLTYMAFEEKIKKKRRKKKRARARHTKNPKPA